MTKFWSDNYSYKNISPKIESSTHRRYVFIHNKNMRKVKDLISEYDIKNILDYGCGNSYSMNYIVDSSTSPVELTKYDPFVSQYSVRPENKFDLVVSHNVINVVEIEYVSKVLEDICEYANKIVLLKIYTKKENVSFYVKKVEELTNVKIKEFSISNYEENKSVFSEFHTEDESLVYMHLLLQKN